MYDNNPTIPINKGIERGEQIDESKQGEVLAESLEKTYPKSFYIESYGCAMNFSDSEIVASILKENGYGPTTDIDSADLLLINTCSIREKAEATVRKRLRIFNKAKKNNPSAMVGVLGCMAERLKDKLLEEEKIVDIVLGPDAYRDLPTLLAGAEDGHRGINVLLSREETYADISPIRLQSNGVSAYISIMRGCDNMCSFCVVPFTRGRERSRSVFSILAEANDLKERGFKEITLLGQNVDSYKWTNPENDETTNFAQLIEMVAKVDSSIRIRFSTSHPKDITDEVLHTMAKYKNLCKYIHLPVQSGSSRVLDLMNRTYTREWYMNRIEAIKRILPGCAISSDIITGFCTETEEEHQETLSIVKWAKFNQSYMFYYSERPGTLAARKHEDDISLEIKKRRLSEVVAVQHQLSHDNNQADVGMTYEVLIDGDSKKSPADFKGRNDHNNVVVFPKVEGFKPGDYINVHIEKASSATLLGKAVI